MVLPNMDLIYIVFISINVARRWAKNCLPFTVSLAILFLSFRGLHGYCLEVNQCLIDQLLNSSANVV